MKPTHIETDPVVIRSICGRPYTGTREEAIRSINPYHKPAGHHTPEVAPVPVYKLTSRERFDLMFLTLLIHEGATSHPPAEQPPSPLGQRATT